MTCRCFYGDWLFNVCLNVFAVVLELSNLVTSMVGGPNRDNQRTFVQNEVLPGVLVCVCVCVCVYVCVCVCVCMWIYIYIYIYIYI